MNQRDKSAIGHILLLTVSQTGPFRNFRDRVHPSQEYSKYFSYEGHLFFEKIQNFMEILQTQQKIEKEILVF